MAKPLFRIPVPAQLSSRPLNVVFAHDPRSRACDFLVERVVQAASPLASACSVEEVGSLEAAWVVLDRARRSPDATLVLACLDLPPAPRAGATVAEWARSLRLPAITVSHGRRWIPSDKAGLALMPTLSPSASHDEVMAVVRSLLDTPASTEEPLIPETFEAPPESFPGRPSWLG